MPGVDQSHKQMYDAKINKILKDQVNFKFECWLQKTWFINLVIR